MDLQKFRERLKEYRGLIGMSQEELADVVYTHKSVLSEALNGKSPPPTDLVHRIIKRLAEREAILGQEQVYELLELTDCEDFSPADWDSPPLVDLAPSKPRPVVPEQPVLQRDALSLDPFNEPAACARYLERIRRRYGFLTLPTGTQQELPLQAAFQPLQLHSGIPPAEDLSYEARRAFLDEPTRDDGDPRYAETKRKESPAHGWEQQKSPVMVAADGDDALEKSPHRRMVILGSPGTGKTTLLRYFMVEIARKAEANLTDLLPIYISLPDFSNSGKTLQEYLLTILGVLGVDNRYSHALWQAIEKGKAFLCLDTLEQVVPDRRRDIIAWINMQASSPGNVWIVSSRFNEYNGGQFNQQFVEWELRPMTYEVGQKLAQALIPELHQQIHGSNASLYDPAAFVNTLEKHPQAVNWGTNPLLFSLAALVFARTGTLPSSRAALYHEVIVAMIAARVSNRNRQTLLRMVIASLALQLYQEKKRIFSREMLLQYLANIRKGQDENWRTEEIAQAVIDTGILEVVSKDTYGYWHQTFAEYFAGVELARHLVYQDTTKDFWDLAWQKRTYSRWTEVLRLMVGILTQEYKPLRGARIALSWLHTLVEQGNMPQGDVGDLGLALAVKSLGEVGEIATLRREREWVQLEEEVAHTWVQGLFEAVQHGHEVRKERLLRLTQEINQFDPSAVELAVKQLVADFASKNVRTREVVLRALGALGRYAPTDLLINSLSDNHSKVRDAAAQALASLGKGAPLEDLVAALRSEHVVVREAATQALGEMRQYAVMHFLVPGLIDEVWSVREATVRALGNLGEQSPVDKLAERLHDESSLVRLAAVEALGKLGERAPVDALISMVEDPDELVRGVTIELLGERAPVDKLIEAVLVVPQGSIPSRFAQMAALEVLGNLDEQRLMEAINTSRLRNGTDSQELLHLIRDSQQATPPEELVKALYEGNKRMCLLAANILGRRKEWAPIEQFITSADGAYRLLRVIAAQILGGLENHDTIRQLLTALADKFSEVRLEAVMALEDLGERISLKAVPIIINLLNDEDWRVRAVSIRILTGLLEHVIIDLPFLEKLCAASSDEHELLRLASKMCLEKLGEKVTIKQLTALFHHPDVSLCVAAINAFGDYAPIELLEDILKSGEARVRTETVYALGEHGGQVPIDLLAGTLEDPDLFVHFATVGILRQLGEWELLADFYDEDDLTDEDDLILSQMTLPTEDTKELDQSRDFFDETEELFTIMTREGGDDDYANRSRSDLQKEYDVLDELMAEIIREPISEEELLLALNSKKSEVRESAILALGEQAPEESLIAALDDEDYRVRSAALQTLGVRTPADKLMAALEDEFDIVSKLAVELLRKREDLIPVDQLIAALQSRSSQMRASVIRVLGVRAPIEKLRDALGDSEKDVRMAAVEVLRQAYPEIMVSLIPELTAVLTKSGSSRVIGSAAESFIAEIIGDLEDASPFLLKKLSQLLDWPFWEVRMKAAQALGKLRRNIPEEAILRLRKLRNDMESPTVSRAADDALAEILSLEVGIEDED